MFNEQDIERMQLNFDENDRLYHITVNMGKKTDSVFNSRLLNYLETKYGATFPVKEKSAEYIWKFIWNIEDGKNSVIALLSVKDGLVVEYDDTAVSQRMSRDADNLNFAEYLNIYKKPSAAEKKGTVSYLDFTLGDSIDKVRGLVLQKYPHARGVDPGTECRCRSKNALKYEIDRKEDAAGKEILLAEIVFCFDMSGKLCEIKLKRFDRPPAYVADVVRFVSRIVGTPSFVSENRQTAQWELEPGRYFLAVSFTDCVSVSFLDIESITRCNNELESKTLLDF